MHPWLTSAMITAVEYFINGAALLFWGEGNDPVLAAADFS
jgi:hypothetical protein